MDLPLIRDLHVLQLEQYWVGRYIGWIFKNFFNFSKLEKTKLRETYKIKALMLAYVISLALVYFLVIRYIGLEVAIGMFVVVCVWPVFLLSPIVFLVQLLEKLLLLVAKTIYRNKLRRHKKLIKIGITGSFGKSSVKNFLCEILDDTSYCVKTPSSYNTVLGIMKVVQMEIMSKVRYFIVEMGAFKRGDITELCYMTEPEYGILTAVGRQHLERFGSIENIRRTKFELVDSISDKNKILVNWDNEVIAEWIEKNKRYEGVLKYSRKNKKADFYINRIKMNGRKTSFSVKYKGKKYKFRSRLFGSSNIENLVAAIGMSMMFGIKVSQIKKSVAEIKPAKNRLEIKKMGRAWVIDNTYSSNEEGFEKLTEDMRKMRGKKVLVTPGIVELGKETKSVHQILGKMAGEVFDEVVLVGESDRTRSLQVGIGRSKKKTKMWFLENFADYWSTVEKLSRKYKWIVLENDLPENY